MPSFLFPETTPTINPYQAPAELALKAGMYRDAKVKESLNNIRSKYDNLLSLQLTNPGNQQFVRDQLKVATDQLEKYSTADLSLPENVGSVMSLFDPVTDDKGVLNDMAFTQHMNRQRAKIDRLSMEDPTAVAPQNVFPLLQAEQSYRRGDRNSTPNYVNFEPYYNFEKADNEYLSKLKQDIYRSPETREVKDPLTGQVIAIRGEREVKEITKQKLAKAMANSFDARKIRQMQLDFNYNQALGVYSSENALKGIDGDIRELQPQLDKITSALNQTGLTNEEREFWTNQKFQAQNQIAKLNETKNLIQSGNDDLRQKGTSSYYTFNKYLKDYVDQKADFYSNKEVGQFEMDDFDKALFKYQTDINLKSLESQLKTREQNAKTKFGRTTNSETGKREDGTYEYTPPMKRILDSIELTGNAYVDRNDPAMVALIGGIREKDNSITFVNTGGGDKDSSKKIYIKEGSVSATPEEAKTVQLNTLIGDSIQKLKKRYPHRFQKDSGPSYLIGVPTSGIPVYSKSGPMDLSPEESVNELQALIETYKSGNITPSARKELKPIVEAFDSLGVEKITPQVLSEYNNFIKSDKGKASVDFGIILNADAKGKYEFIPENTSNVTRLSDNRLGVSGFLKFTAEDLKRMDAPVEEMLETGVLSETPPSVVYENQGDKAVRTSTKTYWMSAMIPVNADLETVNRQMFEQNDMPNLELKIRYGANTIQQNAFREYVNTTRATANQLTETGRGTYVPSSGSALGNHINEFFNKLSNDPTVTPEQAQSVKDEYNILLKVPTTRFDFINNVNKLMNDVNSLLGSKVTGRSNLSLRDELSARESSGDYGATNPNSSATGKYQFLWNTWKDKIQNVTGISSRQDFLNNPQAQENFYTWYEANELLPAVERLKQYNTIGLTDQQLGKLFHFRGEKGAIDYLKGLVPDKPEAYNSSISSYLKPYS